MANQKQFGVWMDTQHATIVGTSDATQEDITVLAHVKGENLSQNSSEKNFNNEAKTLQAKYFKSIASHLQNATHLHVTGTGQIQEQFIHYLADTPQFKNTVTAESTSNKMSDEKLVEFMSDKLK
ncbi:MAG: hypothetical protein ABIN01_17560 [Ferruginibacter sp.]